MPRTTRMIPVTRFKVFGFALFAKVAAIRAQIRVKTMQRIHTVTSGKPPIAKCDTAPVSYSISTNMENQLTVIKNE